MILLLVTLLAGYCVHQHWGRLARPKSGWNLLIWRWVLQGVVFPALVWGLANLGLSIRIPPLVPALADAQMAGAPWFKLWIGVTVAGTLVIATFWAGLTYLWLLVMIMRRVVEQAEFAVSALFVGMISAAAGATLVHFYGPLYAGAALTVALLPVVYSTIYLAETPEEKPAYSRAIARLKFGKYAEAEQAVIAELEKAEEDFDGWMMLAELYARQFRKIEDAAQVILDICQHPSTQPIQVSLACHRLADWQLELEENPAGARAALELLCRKLPGTHFAHMSQQRIKQLPKDDVALRQAKNPRPIRLSALADATFPPDPRPASMNAEAEARRLVQLLTEDPNDLAAREKLALVLAEELRQPGLGIEQLQLLVELAEPSDEQKAKWLAQVAAWEMKLNAGEARSREILARIVRDFPQTAQAFVAQRRLKLLEMGMS